MRLFFFGIKLQFIFILKSCMAICQPAGNQVEHIFLFVHHFIRLNWSLKQFSTGKLNQSPSSTIWRNDNGLCNIFAQHGNHSVRCVSSAKNWDEKKLTSPELLCTLYICTIMYMHFYRYHPHKRNMNNVIWCAIVGVVKSQNDTFMFSIFFKSFFFSSLFLHSWLNGRLMKLSWRMCVYNAKKTTHYVRL